MSENKSEELVYPEGSLNGELFDCRSLEELKKLLKDNQIDTKRVRNWRKETLLHRYSWIVLDGVLAFLIEQGVDVNAQSYDGFTALHNLVRYYPETFEDFLYNGKQNVDTHLKWNADSMNLDVREYAEYLIETKDFGSRPSEVRRIIAIIDDYRKSL